MTMVPSLGITAIALALAAQAGTPLPDPTEPADWAAVPEPVALPEGSREWHVHAVRIGPDARRAIVNGRSVQEGERIGEARVVEIRASAVVIEQAGERIIVSLLPQAVKREVEP